LKYLLGAPGVAFLYIRPELIERLQPSDSGWFGQANVFAYDVHHLAYANAARRFETGSPPVPNIYAASAAIELIADAGLDVIGRHVQGLATLLIRGTRERGFRLLTPEEPAERGPLVMIGSTDAPRLVEALATEGILCSVRDGSLRISLHYYNTAGDVQAVLGALDRHPELLAAEGH
ncbi:MAG TPA: aminotransferase class V-fold PLP-dependent enzyme, partial [Candidatus Limnocylindria bacterium]|nr:aminotransferase class V-fold PLP-dependent enzyme [Candidatus Limnocylindria bacterium]